MKSNKNSSVKSGKRSISSSATNKRKKSLTKRKIQQQKEIQIIEELNASNTDYIAAPKSTIDFQGKPLYSKSSKNNSLKSLTRDQK